MRRLVLISTLLIGSISCGGEEPTLSQGETEQALGVMSTAATFGAITASVNVSPEDASVTATGSCLGGGTLDAAGSITRAAAGASYELDFTFNACVFDGIGMDGTLSYSGSASDDGATFDMSGTLTFAGSVQGTCNIDIKSTSSPTGVTLSGSACGHSVSVQLGIQ